jgi:hypothetical protein
MTCHQGMGRYTRNHTGLDNRAINFESSKFSERQLFIIVSKQACTNHSTRTHHLNPLRMDSLRIFTSSMYELLATTIFPLYEIYHVVWPSPPTSMHSWRICIHIPNSWKGEMPIFWKCIEVGGGGDTSSYIPWSGKMVAVGNTCMDELNILKVSILKGLKWCDTP